MLFTLSVPVMTVSFGTLRAVNTTPNPKPQVSVSLTPKPKPCFHEGVSIGSLGERGAEAGQGRLGGSLETPKAAFAGGCGDFSSC